MRSPVPYRLTPAFEDSGDAVRLREIVEVGALPAPGGPTVVQAIEQQIQRDLLNWQHQTVAKQTPRQSLSFP